MDPGPTGFAYPASTDFADPASTNLLLVERGVWTRGITAIRENKDKSNDPATRSYLVCLDSQRQGPGEYTHSYLKETGQPTVAKNGDKFNNILLVCGGLVVLRWIPW
jgi:hypothetical protein